MNKKFIYFDNAATTPVRTEVLEAMGPYFSQSYGNPSSIYYAGRQSKKAVEDSRQIVAQALNASDREIYFTGSGTEADNWAIKSAVYANAKKGKHIITSAVEHHAVLHVCKYLEKHGYDITYLPVDRDGLIDPDDLKNSIRKDTVLVTIMYANNEIGTIQPIKELGAIAKANNVLFHTDAVQAAGSIPIDVNDLNIDLLSISAHKFNGPKGTGSLYIRRTAKIEPYLHGGAQERNRRAGTENVAGIVGLSTALQLAVEEMDKKNKRITALRDRTIDEVLKKIPYTRLNGHPVKRLPGNVNFSFEFIEGESLLLMLDMKSIAASSGSACTSGALDPSHVLLSIGLPHEIAHGSLRLSYGIYNTEEELDYFLEVLPEMVDKLRQMSPLYEGVK